MDLQDLENHANFRAKAVMDVDQYTTLLAVTNDWIEKNPEEEEVIRILQSIEFERVG